MNIYSCYTIVYWEIGTSLWSTSDVIRYTFKTNDSLPHKNCLTQHSLVRSWLFYYSTVTHPSFMAPPTAMTLTCCITAVALSVKLPDYHVRFSSSRVPLYFCTMNAKINYTPPVQIPSRILPPISRMVYYWSISFKRWPAAMLFVNKTNIGNFRIEMHIY